MQCRVLFITWDGPQVSYLESLFLPIFERLETHGIHFDVLQFRWGDPADTVRIAKLCRSAKIGYRPILIHRSPPVAGPFATAVFGRREVRAAVRDFASELLMPRSLMPALAVLAAGGLRPIIYDADGLEADERVDFGGLSRRSVTYRLLRKLEKQMVQRSQSVLVRTNAAAEVLAARTGVSLGHFHTVTNGRDVTLFSPGTAADRLRVRAELNLPPHAPLLVYLGSVGPKYRLNLVAEFTSIVVGRRDDARLLLLSGSPHAAHAEIVRQNPQLDHVIQAMRVAPEQVARYLRAADVGFAFPAPTFSTQAVVATKVAEYLLCGVPVIGATEVGDTTAAVDAGVFLDEAAGPMAAADWLLDTVIPNRERFREAARAVGAENFSLERAVHDYIGAISLCRDGRQH